MRKFISALMLFIVCVISGGIAAENLKKKTDMLSALVSDLKTVRIGLKTEKHGIGRIVSELSENGNMAELWKEMKKETDANHSFFEAYTASRHTISRLNKTELETLDVFARDFGTSDTESELSRLETLLVKLGEAEKAQSCGCPKKMKLLRSLSTLGGIALALILL